MTILSPGFTNRLLWLNEQCDMIYRVALYRKLFKRQKMTVQTTGDKVKIEEYRKTLGK